MAGQSEAAELLCRARRRAGLSQAEVAARAGVSQSMVAAYENGRRQPTVPTLRRLLDAAGATLRLSAERPDRPAGAARSQPRQPPATSTRSGPRGTRARPAGARPPGARPPGARPAGVRRGALPVGPVAERVAGALAVGDDAGAWRWLVQFTDDFRGSSAPGRSWLVGVPPPSVSDRRYDAALAALVEHLCAEAGVPVPAWTSEATRFAEPWWFPAGLRALRASSLRDSPISFKRHGVFVTANAFHRV